jgi:hypothetical protein
MSTAQGTPKIKGSKGHAGGTGKKGKKFIEDKVGCAAVFAPTAPLTS